MKKYILILIALSLSVGLTAQDEAIFNHYVQSPILVNPAAAGFNDEYQAQLNARASWSGFEDSPKTVALRLNGPVGESFGIGAALYSESAAQQNRLKGQLDVAFRFNIGREVKGVAPVKMAFGFFTEFERVSIDNSVLNNPLYQAGDELLMNFVEGENFFDAGIGVFGTLYENTFGGITINNLVSNRLTNISGGTTENNFNYTILLGHSFMVGNSDVKLTPSLMLRNVQGAPFLMDFNLQAGFLDDQLIAGLSYRNLRAMGLLLGTRLRNIRLYYSYDLSFAEFQSYNNGSHEVTIGFNINRQELKARRDAKAQETRRR
jgi:type IX secretion system PorP/SprF family membrane protein